MTKISKNKVDSFWKKRAKINNPRLSTHFKEDDTHIYDLKFIKKYCNKNSNLLDVACGPCYLTNELAEHVSYIKGTDKYSEYFKHCNISDKLEVVESDILEYQDVKKYDLILMFGIVMYFNEKDRLKIYKNYSKMLAPGGKLIVKHQCGTKENVLIDSYSKQIGDNYHAFYMSVKNDEQLLKKVFSDVQVFDIYPKRLNPWPNTHFYAFVAEN